MQRVLEDDRQYRRGVVLGLTMAEIMLLLIFLLMLLLAIRLGQEREKRLEAEKQVADYMAAVKQVPSGIDDPKEFFKDYVKLKADLDQAKLQLERAKSYLALVETMKQLDPRLSDEEARKKIDEETRLGTVLMAAAGDKDPEQYLKELEKTQQDLQAAGLDPDSFITSAGQCKDQLTTCSNQLASTGVRPGDPPVCWKDEKGKSQSLFEVTLESDGIHVKDLKTPGREAEQASLPLSDFRFGQPMTAAEFRAAGRKVRALSEGKYCRYLVQLVRDPSLQDADRADELRRAVEDIFYKDEG
jgi:hypothetical protein